MNYNPNYRGNRQGQRQPQGNYQGQQQRGNVSGGYKPNTGKAKINEKRRGPTDPFWTGVGNIELANGQKITAFFNVWENEDGSLGFTFKDANAPRENGGYQRPSGGGYSPQGQGGRYRDSGEYNQGPQRPQNGSGAMSRARPIQPPTYNENGPYENSPPPGGPEDYNLQYDDENPPY